MNRTERLLNLLQILRGYRYPVKGERLAERLGISIRTLYRDIATLQAQGAEIAGEAGVGYVLKPSYFLPPLMFSPNEIHSLILGIQWVTQYGDAPLSKAAADALNKIYDVLPAHIKNNINAYTLRVGPPASKALATEDLSVLRDAIAQQKKIEITTKNLSLKLWPFTMGYFTDKRILVGWCEKVNQYIHVITSQISSLKVLNEVYSRPKESLFREWQAIQLKSMA